MAQFPPVSEFIDGPRVNYFKMLLDADYEAEEKSRRGSFRPPVLDPSKYTETKAPKDLRKSPRRVFRDISNRASICLPPSYRLRTRYDGPRCPCLTGHSLLPNTGLDSAGFSHLGSRGCCHRRTIGATGVHSPIPFISPLFVDIAKRQEWDRDAKDMPCQWASECGIGEACKLLRKVEQRVKDQHTRLEAIKRTVEDEDRQEPLRVHFCPFSRTTRYIPSSIYWGPQDFTWRARERFELERATAEGRRRRHEATITSLTQEVNKLKWMTRETAAIIYGTDPGKQVALRHALGRCDNYDGAGCSLEMPRYFKASSAPLDYIPASIHTEDDCEKQHIPKNYENSAGILVKSAEIDSDRQEAAYGNYESPPPADRSGLTTLDAVLTQERCLKASLVPRQRRTPMAKHPVLQDVAAPAFLLEPPAESAVNMNGQYYGELMPPDRRPDKTASTVTGKNYFCCLPSARRRPSSELFRSGQASVSCPLSTQPGKPPCAKIEYVYGWMYQTRLGSAIRN